MSSLDFPFLDLFQQLQQAGMRLSPEQYNLLRQSLAHGFGLASWDDLRQVCRALWVKPSRYYDARVFERVFDCYIAQTGQEIRALQPSETTPLPSPAQTSAPTRRWPQVPPPKMPDSAAAAAARAPVAVKTGLAGLPEVDDSGLSLSPSQLPLSQRTVLDSWQLLRRPLRSGIRSELDLKATIRRITQAGYFSDVVMRPAKGKRTELIVLVDDSNVMVPFRPALHPLTQAIENQQIAPATLYRFTTYPDEYLYAWQQPFQAVPLDQILAQMHRRRTVVVIWSEAGATQSSPRAEHRRGLINFLDRLSPCIRSVVWLNPLPPHRWSGTLAADIARWLDGRMIELGGPQVLEIARQLPADNPVFLRT